MDSWLFYVDDSANEQHDVLAAVCVPVSLWTQRLRSWLDFRKRLAFEHGLPVAYELHASKFVAGRGHPHEDTRRPINWDRGLRRAIYEEALDVVLEMELPVLSVHRTGSQRRMVLYRLLLAQLTNWLEERGANGIVIMDGEDLSYRAIHRELPLVSRRILEDPWLQGSHDSQFIQVADLVAHAALQSVARTPQRTFMWEWFPERFAPFLKPKNAEDAPN